MVQYLFICGCARSGTSATVYVVGSHSRVLMGMERFGHLARGEQFGLRPEHFAAERFATIEPGDTFYDQEQFPAMHAEMDIERKLQDPSSLQYVGDKCPRIYRRYDSVGEHFPDPKFIFTLREPLAVAASYEARLKKGRDWSRNRNYQAAVADWNESVRLTRSAIERGLNVIITGYESLFYEDSDPGNLLQQLRLEQDEAFSRRLKRLRVRADRLRDKPKHELTDEQAAFVRENAAYDEYRELLARNSLAPTT